MITKSIYKKIGVFCAVCGLLTSCAEDTTEQANYGNGAVVNYAVTLTNNSNQKSVVIGETGDTKLSFTNAEMNKILASIVPDRLTTSPYR